MNSKTYYTINNGPNLSSWQPESVLNDKIKEDVNINSNWKYRQYLQQNANQIMKFNTMETINASGNNPYYSTSQSNTNQTNIPQLYNSLHSPSTSQDSDLKRDFLNKQRLSARMISPSISTNF